jgi:hypothetical protein
MVLDLDFLSNEYLDAEADLEFTELDINYLDSNFLEDLLDIIDSLAVINEKRRDFTRRRINKKLLEQA